ncbi:hypothetical protein K438DRAFT_1462855, partial [Mycena galopus ATCC 62051]
HWCVIAYRAYQAFLVSPDASAFYNTLRLPSYTARNISYTMLTLVADSFASYRCYVVWKRNWLVGAIPALLLLATAVAGFGTTYVFTTVEPGNPIFQAPIVPWITSWIALTLSTNIVCTSLIAYRIIGTTRAVKEFRIGRDRLSATLIVIVESAAIYSATLIAIMIAYLCGNNGQFVVLDMVRLQGIAFTMIIIRVILG